MGQHLSEILTKFTRDGGPRKHLRMGNVLSFLDTEGRLGILPVPLSYCESTNILSSGIVDRTIV